MTKLFVVIDEGCQECGVGSVPIGIFKTQDEAEQKAEARHNETGGWRDGGQTDCNYYEMELEDD